MKAQHLLNGGNNTGVTFLNKLFKILTNFSNLKDFLLLPKYILMIYKGTQWIHVNVFLSAKWG